MIIINQQKINIVDHNYNF